MKHKEFILTPLSSLIEQTLQPLDLYKGQICNYIMKEYVLQTLFMKLTGCMEQKAKCILWDIATHDFEYRRVFLHDNSLQTLLYMISRLFQTTKIQIFSKQFTTSFQILVLFVLLFQTTKIQISQSNHRYKVIKPIMDIIVMGLMCFTKVILKPLLF